MVVFSFEMTTVWSPDSLADTTLFKSFITLTGTLNGACRIAAA
jgi:hypothetical protein